LKFCRRASDESKKYTQYPRSRGVAEAGIVNSVDWYFWISDAPARTQRANADGKNIFIPPLLIIADAAAPRLLIEALPVLQRSD